MIVPSAALMLCVIPYVVHGAETQPGLSFVGLSAQNLQPGLNLVGALANISMRVEDWPHDTPLLWNHGHADEPLTASRRAIKSWSGWNSINYIFSLYVDTDTLRWFQ